MKKETFVKIINAIKKLQEDRGMLAEGIEKFVDGYVIVTLGDETVEDLIDALSFELGDKYEWISWWFFEDVDKVVSFEDGRPDIRLDTPEQLYDFLKGE